MEQLFKILSGISSFFYIVLPFAIIGVIVLIVILLLQVAHFFKKLETTQKKSDNLNAKMNAMEQSFLTSTTAPEIMNASSYRDLQFKSQIARTALGFTVDNSEDIVNWSHKAVNGYRKFKKKRNK